MPPLCRIFVQLALPWSLLSPCLLFVIPLRGLPRGQALNSTTCPRKIVMPQSMSPLLPTTIPPKSPLLSTSPIQSSSTSYPPSSTAPAQSTSSSVPAPRSKLNARRMSTMSEKSKGKQRAELLSPEENAKGLSIHTQHSPRDTDTQWIESRIS